MNIHIEIKDGVTAEIRRIALGLGKVREFHQALTLDARDEVAKHIEQHLVPNQRPGIEFWQQAVASMETNATDERGEIVIGKVGFKLRYYGGEVRPGKSLSSYTGKPTRALSIPTANVPTKGGTYVRPGRAGHLAFISEAKGRETVGYLVEGEVVTNRRGSNKGKKRVKPREGGRLMYVLRSVTRHKGNRGILPTDEALGAVLKASAGRFLDSLAD
jgi:hypothetical protein